MQRIILIALGAAVVVCARAEPQAFDSPLIFIGSLEAETLFEQSVCEPPPWGKSITAHSSTGPVELERVCVGNGCGYGEAVFRVHAILAGNFDGDQGVVRYTMGEWCQSEFPDGGERLLICVSHSDNTHRFLSERVYQSNQGDVILLESIRQLGEIRLASLLRPLLEPIGSAVEGVFITDLIQALATEHWRPRRLALIRDETGGFRDIVDADGPNGIPAAPHGYQELWDC